MFYQLRCRDVRCLCSTELSSCHVWWHFSVCLHVSRHVCVDMKPPPLTWETNLSFCRNNWSSQDFKNKLKPTRTNATERERHTAGWLEVQYSCNLCLSPWGSMSFRILKSLCLIFFNLRCQIASFPSPVQLIIVSLRLLFMKWPVVGGVQSMSELMNSLQTKWNKMWI